MILRPVGEPLRKTLVLAIVLVAGILAVAMLSNTPQGEVKPSSEPSKTTSTTTSTHTTTTEVKPEAKRADKIPTTAVKVTPEADVYPPILHVEGWHQPVPITVGINTAGAEDSPFITPDGNTFYFFFTPDMNIPVEKQLTDGVTGIWYSTWTIDGWSEARRLRLGTGLSMDGAECLRSDELWFASARAGNYRGVDFWIATLKDNAASDIRNAGARLNEEIKVGELHISADGQTIYFDSPVEGGKGGTDIWVTHLVDGVWSDPENVGDVNTEENDSRPFLSQDGSELWFTRTYMGTPAIYRSTMTETGWSTPELIISQFAGEPSLDAMGNIYFVHHFMKDGQFLEADIYVAYKK
jgi:hypothetical protein